jgi:hypothetical protein
MKTRALLTVVLVLALAACGSDGGDTAAGGGDAPVTSEPSAVASEGPNDRPGPRLVEPEDGLVNVTPTAWQHAKVAPDGLSARLTWYSGVEECYGLDRIAVYPREDMVVVTLFAGSRPEAETCIELAEKVVTVVEFREPVGDRELVDGALPD